MPPRIDLAAERVGGKAVAANDEFFAPKENLLRPGRGIFREGEYTDRGKWMDGWETRRRREPGHDWCVVRLGMPGVPREIVVDTNHFRGNHPEACSIEGARLEAEPSDWESSEGWTEIVPRSELRGHSENSFEPAGDAAITHVRLRIYPDGGVARLRVYGDVRSTPEQLKASEGPIDLVAVENGGQPLDCSDQFFSEPLNLIMPGRAENMGDGWETRRRRGPGHDWVILALGCRGVIEEIEIDTNHFKGNYPESASLEACDGPTSSFEDETSWTELLPRTKLGPHAQHVFTKEIAAHPAVTLVRLSIFPDGGVSRLRLRGRPTEEGA